jgi:antigen flippase
MNSRSSYNQILKSSSLIGAAQGINMVLGIVRLKFAAMLIGPVGVGLIGNYTAILGLVGVLAGLGLQTSGVREVAAVKDDPQAVGRLIAALRRVCWLTGALGALAMAALARLLSRWTFGHDDYALEIGLLGVVVLLVNVSVGQMALIQGLRRVGDLARLQVVSGVAGTAIAVGCYAMLGLAGIVPALLLIGAVQLWASWYFARRVPVSGVKVSWRETFHLAGGLVRLGLVFMWTGLAASTVAYLTRVMITQQLGLEAVGLFTAAFGLSGMFVKFVLSAMGADYFPRLTAVAADRVAVNRLVNEQTEIGLLLAVPGLLAMLALAPWVVRFFYSEAFLPATELLQWFILGCLMQVISWPIGFVMLALGKGRLFFCTQTLFSGVHLVFVWIGLMAMGLEGVSVAFFLLYVFSTGVVMLVARHLTGFWWSASSRRLLLVVLPIVAVMFFAARLLPLLPATVCGVLALVVTSVLCLQGLAERVGVNHRIVRAACWLPGMRWLIRARGDN